VRREGAKGFRAGLIQMKLATRISVTSTGVVCLGVLGSLEALLVAREMDRILTSLISENVPSVLGGAGAGNRPPGAEGPGLLVYPRPRRPEVAGRAATKRLSFSRWLAKAEASAHTGEEKRVPGRAQARLRPVRRQPAIPSSRWPEQGRRKKPPPLLLRKGVGELYPRAIAACQGFLAANERYIDQAPSERRDELHRASIMVAVMVGAQPELRDHVSCAPVPRHPAAAQANGAGSKELFGCEADRRGAPLPIPQSKTRTYGADYAAPGLETRSAMPPFPGAVRNRGGRIALRAACDRDAAHHALVVGGPVRRVVVRAAPFEPRSPGSQSPEGRQPPKDELRAVDFYLRSLMSDVTENALQPGAEAGPGSSMPRSWRPWGGWPPASGTRSAIRSPPWRCACTPCARRWKALPTWKRIYGSFPRRSSTWSRSCGISSNSPARPL